MTPQHVLLSAYQCAPGGGSVSQIGWEWYSRLSCEVPVTLVTHSRNRAALQQAGAPLAGSEIVYIDTEWFARPLYRFASYFFKKSEHTVFLIASLDFFVYDAAAVKTLKKRAPQFSVVHSVTPVSPLAVTRLHKLGRPLIVGPWNGGMSTPRGFRATLPEDSIWIRAARALARLADLFVGCVKRAARVLTATAATDECLPNGAARERMLENGVDLDLFRPREAPPEPSSHQPLRVLFVGRLIQVKSVNLLLEAAALVRDRFPISITIAGDGVLRPSLERQADQLGLSSVVKFTGSVGRVEVAALMSEAHLFCLPSVRESGGAVILEAMASALPVLTVAYGGPGELVDEEVGRALLPDSPASLVQGMADTLADFYRHPADWKQRGHNGRLRAEKMYSWPQKIRRAIEIYADVVREQDDFARSGKACRHSARRSAA